MKDIKINTPFMKIQYVISWVGFILGLLIGWLIALGLYNYGKNTVENKDKTRGVLNMTYQKFIFVYGSIIGDILLIFLVIGLIMGILELI